MRIKMAAMAAVAMMAVAGCGSEAARTDALQSAWDSFDTVGHKAFCEATIQDGENFYGPARALAAKAGNGVTEHDAFQFLLNPGTCPNEWLFGPDRF